MFEDLIPNDPEPDENKRRIGIIFGYFEHIMDTETIDTLDIKSLTRECKKMVEYLETGTVK